MEPKYQIKWFEQVRSWRYSTNGGKSWNHLNADDPNASYEAIDEAAELVGVPTNQWDLVEDTPQED